MVEGLRESEDGRLMEATAACGESRRETIKARARAGQMLEKLNTPSVGRGGRRNRS